MENLRFFIVDAFTETAFQGNPAGVFLEGNAGLSDERRMRLCAELSLESAFVLEETETDAAFRLRFYTSVMEVPFCGHATVAALRALRQEGKIRPEGDVKIATRIGVLTIRHQFRADGEIGITLYQNPGQFTPPLTPEQASELSAALGEAARADGLPVQRVSTGSPWLLFPARDRATVDAILPQAIAAGVTELSRRYDVLGVYVFAIDMQNGVPAVWSRCFCPLAGLPEDPVTGSASGTLGCYLTEYGVLSAPEGEPATITARQGFGGGRGGTAEITVVRDGAFWRPSVTGTAVIVAEGGIRL